MKEPIRMRETDQLPASLRDAFGALGRDAPSAETVLRVQRALEALPAVTPTAAAVGTFGASKLLVLVTLVAGAVTTTLVVRSRQVPARPVAAERAEHVTAQPQPLEPSAPRSEGPASVGETASPALEPQALAETAASGAAGERAQASASEPWPQRPPARVRARTPGGTAAPGAELSPQWAQSLLAPAAARPATAASVQSGAAVQAVAATPVTPAASEAAEPATPVQVTPPAPAPSLAAAQASEAQKLAQCKRLAAHEPAEALRQLEALAREAPHGTFVQERELLEIRLHERLGHGARATELTQRFLERHPNSVYRRALAP